MVALSLFITAGILEDGGDLTTEAWYRNPDTGGLSSKAKAAQPWLFAFQVQHPQSLATIPDAQLSPLGEWEGQSLSIAVFQLLPVKAKALSRPSADYGYGMSCERSGESKWHGSVQ